MVKKLYFKPPEFVPLFGIALAPMLKCADTMAAEIDVAMLEWQRSCHPKTGVRSERGTA